MSIDKISLKMVNGKRITIEGENLGMEDVQTAIAGHTQPRGSGVRRKPRRKKQIMAESDLLHLLPRLGGWMQVDEYGTPRNPLPEHLPDVRMFDFGAMWRLADAKLIVVQESKYRRTFLDDMYYTLILTRKGQQQARQES